MLPAGAIDPYIAGNLIGFSVGAVISTSLLVLTMRAARLPGTPEANIALAVCSLLWNLGGLANVIQNGQGTPNTLGPDCIALAIQFTGAAVWPIPMLSVWRHLAMQRWQCIGWRSLQLLAIASAGAIVTGVWAAVARIEILPLSTLKEFSAYNATGLLFLAIALLLRRRSVSRAVRSASVVALLGLVITTVSVIIQSSVRLTDAWQCALGVIGEQSVLLVIIGTFFLFARFRFADLFIRASLRAVLASVLAAFFTLLVNARMMQQLAAHTEFPWAVRFYATAILIAALLVCFVPLDRRVGRLVNRWIFHAPDYRIAARDVGDRLRPLYSECDVTAAVEKSVRETLGVENVRSIPLTRLPVQLWPPEIHDGEIAELGAGHPLASLLSLPDIEVLVPVRAEARVISVLAISPGPARRGLVSQELNYLRSVAEQFGSRLDLLRLDREMVERQNHEALLLQQVTEAELRALRAQINPHFLFNSLNTIANLIVTNPARAETMTLRLAKVFRHVLAHSSRPLVPIREEIEFLRSYLEIEEARFGSRLQVEIDIAPEVAHAAVPSLILQPLVENALKHGLGPKTGPGRLWITAKPDGEQVYLAVEDDGVGPDEGKLAKPNGNGAHSNGVGLTNVTQRLATLYQGKARVALESRKPEGTRVTLLVPRDPAWNGHEVPHR